MKTWQLIIPLAAAAIGLLAGCASPAADAATLAKEAAVAVTEAAPASPDTPPASCPVTQPPDPAFDPPTHLPALQDEFWYGTPGLWTSLRDDGRWWGLPHSGDGYGQKLGFWREGYDMETEPQPELTISGRRLDGDAPAVSSDRATNAYHPDYGEFMMTGVEVPTLGCWEITGEYHGQTLSFVVWIAP